MIVVAMLTSVCADETSEITVGHGVVVVASSHCVIDGGGTCVSFGRAVPASGGLFRSFMKNAETGKLAETDKQKPRNGRALSSQTYPWCFRSPRPQNKCAYGLMFGW